MKKIYCFFLLIAFACSSERPLKQAGKLETTDRKNKRLEGFYDLLVAKDTLQIISNLELSGSKKSEINMSRATLAGALTFYEKPLSKKVFPTEKEGVLSLSVNTESGEYRLFVYFSDNDQIITISPGIMTEVPVYRDTNQILDYVDKYRQGVSLLPFYLENNPETEEICYKLTQRTVNIQSISTIHARLDLRQKNGIYQPVLKCFVKEKHGTIMMSLSESAGRQKIVTFSHGLFSSSINRQGGFHKYLVTFAEAVKGNRIDEFTAIIKNNIPDSRYVEASISSAKAVNLYYSQVIDYEIVESKKASNTEILFFCKNGNIKLKFRLTTHGELMIIQPNGPLEKSYAREEEFKRFLAMYVKNEDLYPLLVATDKEEKYKKKCSELLKKEKDRFSDYKVEVCFPVSGDFITENGKNIRRAAVLVRYRSQNDEIQFHCALDEDDKFQLVGCV